MRRTKALTNEGLLDRVRDYLPHASSIWETDCSDQPTHNVTPDRLLPNTFYVFDADAIVALTRAIEDVALDEGNGKFLAACQNVEQFKSEREKYEQLVRTLDEVQIIATGKLARHPKGLQYCNDAKAVFETFWVTLHEGLRNRVLFVGEQRNNTKKFEDKQFVGFYTFDRDIIRQAREDIAELLGGSCPELQHFKRLRRLDLATKRLNVEFERESKNLEVAIRRLRGSRKYRVQHFIEDFEKTLQRLSDLKAHLPEIISGHRLTK